MSADFSFDVDVARDLVRIRMAGFFGADDIARFLKVRRAAYDRLTCAPNQHLTLTDIRDMKIQSQEAVVEFAKMLADPRYHSRRHAIVVASTLARLQVTRAAGERHQPQFATIEEAEAWLFADADDKSGRAQAAA